MGVDAEVYIGVHREKDKFSQEDLRSLSFEIGSRFGSTHFMLTGSMDQETDDDLFVSDETERLSTGLPPRSFGDRDVIERYEYAQALRVQCMYRYYGPGYERGPFQDIYMLLYYLSRRVQPFAHVFYCGDSDNPCDALEADVAMAELLEHWMIHGYYPYRRGERITIRFSDEREPQNCPRCHVPFMEAGGGGGDTFWACDGCGKSIIEDRHGNMHVLGRHEDFFHGYSRLKDEGRIA